MTGLSYFISHLRLGKSSMSPPYQPWYCKYQTNLKTLWNDDAGMFLNKRLDTNAWNYSISPTNFYALNGKVATQAQAERMIQEHFYNPQEFWGDYIMPSIARNDPGYTGRDYWKGAIWAPMNFLVYLGFRNYDLPKARKDLARKSSDLLLKNWESKGQVLENYHAETGEYPGYRSEYFYHWGALLGMINMIEYGFMPPTEQQLQLIQ
ncbi:MGH1-like glycoside hydrolase domain-containing protein [Persicobacter psychrovividus]